MKKGKSDQDGSDGFKRVKDRSGSRSRSKQTSMDFNRQSVVKKQSPFNQNQKPQHLKKEKQSDGYHQFQDEVLRINNQSESSFAGFSGSVPMGSVLASQKQLSSNASKNNLQENLLGSHSKNLRDKQRSAMSVKQTPNRWDDGKQPMRHNRDRSKSRDQSPTVVDDSDDDDQAAGNRRKSMASFIKRQPTSSSRPSFVKQKPQMIQSQGKFKTAINDDTSTSNRERRSSVSPSRGARSSYSKPRVSAIKSSKPIEFEPSDSVGHESMDEYQFDPTTASFNQNNRVSETEMAELKNEKAKKQKKSNRKVYYADQNESMDSNEDHKGEFDSRQSYDSRELMFDSNQYSMSDKDVLERIQKSIHDHQSSQVEPLIKDKDVINKFALNEETDKKNREVHQEYQYKDAMNNMQVFSYSVGHLVNDLIIQIWNSFQVWYLIKVINLSEGATGQIGALGEFVDALAQPLLGYMSDNLNTRYGQRIPVYFLSACITLPTFFLVFNPPDFAVGSNSMSAHGWAPYFFVIATIMQIGKGGMTLAHLSLMNSITYDQKRRDQLINYRNSVAYIAGLIVPALSTYLFKYVPSEQDSFSYLANICLFAGIITSVIFLLNINETKLVRESRLKFNEFLMVPVDEVDSHGKLFDVDDDQVSGFFGDDHSNDDGYKNKKSRDFANQDHYQNDQIINFQDSDSGDDMFNYLQNVKRGQKQRRETVSVGGKNHYKRNTRSKSPVEKNTQSSKNITQSNKDTVSYLIGPDRANNMQGDVDSVPSIGGDLDSVADRNDQPQQRQKQKKKVKIHEEIEFNNQDVGSKQKKLSRNQPFSKTEANLKNIDMYSDNAAATRFQRQNMRMVDQGREDSNSSLYTSQSSIVKIDEFDNKKTQAAAHTENKGGLSFWFKRSDFYVTGLDFVCSRIAIMTQSVTIAFYVEIVCLYKAKDINNDGEADGTPWQIGVAQGVSFIASFIFSILIQDKLQEYHTHDKYNLFLYSIVSFTLGGFFLFFIVISPFQREDGSWGNDSIYTPIMLYIGMFIQGCGMANMMNSSTSLVSEMIGQDDEASAIVFASFNIIESFSNGGVAYILTTFQLVNEPTYMRWILSIVPIICSILAYTVSYFRFKKRTEEFFASGNHDLHYDSNAAYQRKKSQIDRNTYRSIA